MPSSSQSTSLWEVQRPREFWWQRRLSFAALTLASVEVAPSSSLVSAAFQHTHTHTHTHSHTHTHTHTHTLTHFHTHTHTIFCCVGYTKQPSLFQGGGAEGGRGNPCHCGGNQSRAGGAVEGGSGQPADHDQRETNCGQSLHQVERCPRGTAHSK